MQLLGETARASGNVRAVLRSSNLLLSTIPHCNRSCSPTPRAPPETIMHQGFTINVLPVCVMLGVGEMLISTLRTMECGMTWNVYRKIPPPPHGRRSSDLLLTSLTTSLPCRVHLIWPPPCTCSSGQVIDELAPAASRSVAQRLVPAPTLAYT